MSAGGPWLKLCPVNSNCDWAIVVSKATPASAEFSSSETRLLPGSNGGTKSEKVAPYSPCGVSLCSTPEFYDGSFFGNTNFIR